MTKLGPPSELKVSAIPRPPLGPNDVSVEIQAAGINPSDIASITGLFPNTPLPRIVGRDFSGRVCDGPNELIGAEVWGSGGDLGIYRNGTHADYLVISRQAVSRRPKNLSAEEAAAVGVPFITAWSALVELGQLKPGEWVIISGAAGAVGSAAIEIAAARQAKIIALIKGREGEERIDRSKVAALAHSDLGDLPTVVSQATNGKGCDLALNAVGGSIFQPLLDGLGKDGRMVIYSARFGRETALDLFSLYRRRLTLYGLDTVALDSVQCSQALEQLTPLFESGALRPPAISNRYPLAKAAEAYELVAKGASGKVILIPGAERR